MENKQNTYIVVEPRWMTGELGLTGNRLIVYALVHGFSREGLGEFYGSAQYVADLLNLRKHTVLDILNALTQEGLLIKVETVRDGVRYCIYRTREGVVRKPHQGGAETAPGGGAKTAPNNKPLFYDKSTNKGEINKRIEGAGARDGLQISRFDFVKALRDAGCDAVAIEDFMAARKAKRLPNTRSAFDGLVAEAAAVGQSLPAIVKLCASRGWGGFRRSYLNEERQGPTPTPPHRESVYEHNLRTRQQLDAYYAQKIAEEKAAREGGNK